MEKVKNCICCENCEHFVKHYALTDGLGLIKLCGGHCLISHKYHYTDFSCKQYASLSKEMKQLYKSRDKYVDIMIEYINLNRTLKNVNNNFVKIGNKLKEKINKN